MISDLSPLSPADSEAVTVASKGEVIIASRAASAPVTQKLWQGLCSSNLRLDGEVK